MRLAHIKKIGIIALLLGSCSESNSVDVIAPEPFNEGLVPTSSLLVFPEDKKECTEGVVINRNSSKVNFRWNTSENTDIYEVNLKNLNDNVSSKVIAQTNNVDIVLERGVPYEWFVVSKSETNTTTKSSEVFRFFNQGIGVENYSPFPAEAVSPRRGANLGSTTTKVNLAWIGSDVEDNIESYDVFYGTDKSNLSAIANKITSQSIVDVPVVSGTVYFWQVVTRDDLGSTSESEFFEFKVN